MRTRAAMILIATATVVAGCGGAPNDPFIELSDGGASVSTIGGGTADVPEPGAASTAPSAPSAPSTPSSSADPSTSSVAPVATPPVTITRNGVATPLELASVAFGETVEAAVVCLAEPSTCDPAGVAVAGGPAHERFAKLVAVFHERGYVARRAADLSHWAVEAVSETPDPDVLVAVVCDVDADEVIEPAAHNGLGMDLTINDQMVARRVRVELRRTPAGWRRWSVEQLGEWPMEPTCGAN